MTLPTNHHDLWLDPGFQNEDEITELLKPLDANLMRRYPVSTRVNLVANDDPQCAEPIRLERAAASSDLPEQLRWFD